MMSSKVMPTVRKAEFWDMPQIEALRDEQCAKIGMAPVITENAQWMVAVSGDVVLAALATFEVNMIDGPAFFVTDLYGADGADGKVGIAALNRQLDGFLATRPEMKFLTMVPTANVELHQHLPKHGWKTSGTLFEKRGS